MSFLLRTLPRQTANLATGRAFTTSPLARKSAVDAAKDTIKGADRTVSQAAVKGIEKGEEVAASMKSTASSKASEAEAHAKPMMGEAKGKAAELKGEVKGKTEEIKGKM